MRYGRFLGLTVIVSLLAACSGSATPSPVASATPSPVASAAPATPGPATSASAAPSPSPSSSSFAGTTIRVVKSAANAFDDASIGYFMQQLKDKYGINVQYNSVATANVELRALVSNSTDLAVAMSLTDVVNLVQQSGSDVKLIAADTYASDYFLVSRSSIATVADLKGKTEGISAPGDASELISHICLNNLGFDYSSLKVVQIGGTSARVAALLAGQIDVGAAHVADAAAAVAKSNGKLKELVDCGKAVGNYPVTGMIVQGSWLKANPQLAQAVVDTYIDAMRWAASNKDAFITFAKTWVPDQPADQMPAAWDYFKSVGFWPVNGGLDLHSLETYLGYAAQLQVLTGKIPTTDTWVDDSFVLNYLARNGSQ
jgi:ABC-type nitrate/sulfonate/bicarbonate transport system substrate-binding protein